MLSLQVKMNKKAVSPLIATVLLIAFAVSLGAVVMNWTSGAIQESSPDEHFDVCENVKISVLMKNSEKSICLDREKSQIVLDIENGPVSVDGLRLSYLAKDSNFVDYTKRIEAGILSHVALGYDVGLYGELSNVKIVPLIGETLCTDGGESFSSISDC